MSVAVHGWRKLFIVRCAKTNELTLKGQAGMHQHQNPSQSSSCKNYGKTGMWITPQAKERGDLSYDERQHGVETCPRFDCTCGFYGYRTYAAMMKDSYGTQEYSPYLQFHVTCIGETILHEEGFRAQRYRIDYALTPKNADVKMGVWSFVTPTTTSPVPYYHMTETITQIEALTEIAKALDFPILDKDSPDGCKECQVVNGWVDAEGQTVAIRCQCYSPAQDKEYGRYRRLHVYSPEDGTARSGLWKCSICGTMRLGPKKES